MTLSNAARRGSKPASLPQETEFSHAELPTVEAVLAAVRDLDRSYVAVQGPPGSGKTFLGSQVIAKLVAAGAKVGVVAQSHAVVENMLTACLERNLFPAEWVMRAKGKSQLPDYPWVEVSDKDLTALLDKSGGLSSEKSGTGTSPGVLLAGPPGILRTRTGFLRARSTCSLLTKPGSSRSPTP